MSNGLTLSADYGYAYFSAELAPPFESSGRNKNANVSVQMPWIRNYTDTFSSSIGWMYTNADADLTGLSISNTNLQLLNIGASESHAWGFGGVTQVSGSLHSNFKGYSNTSCNTFQCRDEEARVELNLQHLQPLPWQMQVLAAFDGVYSPNELPDTEKISIGGPTSVRGFAPSATRGDRGWYGQLTLRRPFAIGPVVVTPRGFGDTGVVYGLDMDSGSPSNSLSSAGAGLDGAWKMVTFRMDWSEPLDSKGGTETAGRDDYGRFYGSISATF
jgi:hemolysin activation/secretion protein